MPRLRSSPEYRSSSNAPNRTTFDPAVRLDTVEGRLPRIRFFVTCNVFHGLAVKIHAGRRRLTLLRLPSQDAHRTARPTQVRITYWKGMLCSHLRPTASAALASQHWRWYSDSLSQTPRH